MPDIISNTDTEVLVFDDTDVSVVESSDVERLVIESETSFDVVSEGIQGPTGATGPAGATGATGATGEGLVAGGSVSEFLLKNSSTDYDTVWVRGLFNVRAFGAVGDGVTDDTTAILAAQTAAAAVNGAVYFPSGNYVMSSPFATNTDHIAFVGDGARMTTITVTSALASQWLFTWDNCWRNGQEQVDDTVYDQSADKAGSFIHGIAFAADRAFAANGIRFLDGNDCFYMNDVVWYYFAGTALDTGADVDSYLRESTFNNVRWIGCGNQEAVPGVNIETGTGIAGDGTNHVVFTDCWYAYNHGPFRIANESANEVERRIVVDGLMLHGTMDLATTDPACDVMLIEGRLQSVLLNNVRMNSSHDTGTTVYAGIRIRSLSGYIPKRVTITNYDQVNCDGDGIVVESCESLFIQGQSAPADILGDELRFEANSIDNAVVFLQARTADTRAITIDATVVDKVYGFWGSQQVAPGLDSYGNIDVLSGDINMASGGQIYIDNGTPTNPGLAFANDTDTGLLLLSDGVAAFYVANNRIMSWESSLLRIQDTVNFAFSSVTGTKFGTSTAQKFAFWNTTPRARGTISGTDVSTVLDDLLAYLGAVNGTGIGLLTDSTGTLVVDGGSP